MTRAGGRPPSPARDVATRVLHRVDRDGAWATPVLDAELSRRELTPRDAALATEIVYGALRVLPSLDAALAARLRRPDRTEAYLRASLRAAAYQLRHLARVPALAAVADAVALVRRERGAGLARVANAVLRRLALDRPAAPAPPDRIDLPAWVEERLRASVGDRESRAFLAGRRLPPPLGLRAVREDPVALARTLRERGAEVATSRFAPRGVAVRGAGDPRRLPGYATGAFEVQELGAQVACAYVAARPGEAVADVCAGRGTKALALAEAVGPTGRVVAADRLPEKLAAIPPARRRLGLDAVPVETQGVDITVGLGGLAGPFDRVLVDAPCTGLGTVHRRPELVLRLTPGDPARLAELQGALLRRASSLVRPGGLLAYVVCSPLAEEGAAVADAFEGEAPGFHRVTEVPPGLPAADSDGVVRLGPWTDADVALDAYQVARWRAPGSPG
ncbi:MAG: RsmB/NOP family class I SAM-dependent RNA methyltransferase [Sandaracinaceae bacterium]